MKQDYFRYKQQLTEQMQEFIGNKILEIDEIVSKTCYDLVKPYNEQIYNDLVEKANQARDYSQQELLQAVGTIEEIYHDLLSLSSFEQELDAVEKVADLQLDQAIYQQLQSDVDWIREKEEEVMESAPPQVKEEYREVLSGNLSLENAEEIDRKSLEQQISEVWLSLLDFVELLPE